MAEYFATKEKDLWLKFDAESTNKHKRLQEINKSQLLTEKTLLLEEKAELPDGTKEADLTAWAVEHYPESESYQRRLQIDERIVVIDLDLGAMK